MACLYLKNRDLSKYELGRFKSAVKAFGAKLEVSEHDYRDGLIGLIAPTSPYRARIQITCSEEKIVDVEHLCRHFRFEISREPLSKSKPARIDQRL